MRGMEFSDPEPAGDGGVELSLGLSIGGSQRRAPNPGPARHGSRIRLRFEDDVDDLDWSLPFDRGDPFGRQEGRKDGIFGEGNGVAAEDRAALEAQALEWRARERVGREREAFVADCRRQSDGPNASITGIPGPNPNPVAYGSHPFPAMVMQYPYHHVQYVPVPNGHGFPFAMPCWAPAVSPVAGEGSSHSERNLFLPVACRGLPVSASAANASRGIVGGCYLDMRSVGINGASSAINSPASSSSGVLEHRSGSLRGSSISSDSRSHSAHTMPEKLGSQQSSQVTNLQGHQPHHVPPSSSQIMEQGTEKVASTAGSNVVLTSATSAMGKLDGAASVNKPISTADDQNPHDSSSLPRMPYVSTTGNGPNGKTVTGLLYRYTKTEVSIVCVCHGSSFSPAEFVRHAGGTNISHPLRQIVIVSS